MVTVMGGGLLDMEEERHLDKLSRLIQHQNEATILRAASIQERRESIQSYRPGRWIAEAGGFEAKSFAVPEVTTLLVVGPMGAGKSTLINNMVRVVNDMNAGFDRAQVCGDPSENGTLFLREYMLCNAAKNICVFDTRGFSEMDTDEDLSMVRDWMKNGVKHGGIVQRSTGPDGDSLSVRARHGHHLHSATRQVNFVIFVVSAVAVLNEKREGAKHRSPLAKLYKSSFLTFKDDRPVVVMTHGDELSAEDRVAARFHLGGILGVSAVNQIFDVPGYTGRYMEKPDQDLVADMTTLDMLEYALMRADRNLCYKQSVLQAISTQLCSFRPLALSPPHSVGGQAPEMELSKQLLLLLAALLTAWVLVVAALIAYSSKR